MEQEASARAHHEDAQQLHSGVRPEGADGARKMEPFRLLDLPQVPLQEVARKAGLEARAVCRALLEAYGPLQGGLRLDSFGLEQLKYILANMCASMRGITSLELCSVLTDQWLLRGQSPDQGYRSQIEYQRIRADSSEYQHILAMLPSTFPRLRALSLPDAHVDLSDTALGQLVPFSANLTSLTLNYHDTAPPPSPPGRSRSAPPDPQTHAPGAVHTLRSFTALRSLSMVRWTPAESPERAAQWLRTLGALPHLVDLRWSCVLGDDRGASLSASLWLPRLARALPQLTSLRVDKLRDWDHPAVRALQKGFPALRALALEISDWNVHTNNSALGPAVVDALAARTGLTSLAVAALWRHWDVAMLAALRITDLTLVSYHGGKVAEVFTAVGAQPALTRLKLRPADGHAPVASLRRLCALTNLARLELEFWGCSCHSTDLMEGLASCTPRLADLRLVYIHDPVNEFPGLMTWDPQASELLAALTLLSTLHLKMDPLPGHLMPTIGRLTRLRELKLEQFGSNSTREIGDAALGSHLQPLRRLSRLELRRLPGVQGLGLGVLRGLPLLEDLQLDQMSRAVSRLHCHLLPLPPRLRKLTLDWFTVGAEAYHALAAAAELQVCATIMQRAQGL